MLGYVFGAVSTGKATAHVSNARPNSFLEFLANRSHNISVEHIHTFCGIDSIFTVLLVKDFAFTIGSVTFGRLIDSGQLP
jgi:hypothetical protein